MKESNYKITPGHSEKQDGQTDFGRVYFNTPHHVDEPTSTEELAELLKSYNAAGTPVTIRNTGHSMNGQTLTDGVQISVTKLKGINFDKPKEIVSVGAGVSWDEMLKAIGFSKYCPPVFPNNPGQTIHVAGQVAVGGIGFYSSKQGGLWNWVKEITLVTMTGEIVPCSRTVKPELFAYSLGGFGRIGVIAEVVLEVRPCSEHVIPIQLIYLNHGHFIKDVARALADEYFDGVVYSHSFLTPRHREFPRLPANGILVFIEKHRAKTLEEINKYLTETYSGGIQNFPSWPSSTTLEDKEGTEVLKRDIVYFPPSSEEFGQYDLCHPWNDYVIAPRNFEKFYREAEGMLSSKKFEAFGVKMATHESKFKLNVGVAGYGIKNLSLTDGFGYPLSLDLPEEPLAIHVGSALSVPVSMLKEATEVIDELTHILYEVGGKRYLCGYHALTRDEIRKHYGEFVIEKWNALKRELDPKHLLNNGVIEHLDDL